MSFATSRQLKVQIHHSPATTGALCCTSKPAKTVVGIENLLERQRLTSRAHKLIYHADHLPCLCICGWWQAWIEGGDESSMRDDEVRYLRYRPICFSARSCIHRLAHSIESWQSRNFTSNNDCDYFVPVQVVIVSANPENLQMSKSLFIMGFLMQKFRVS